MSRAERALEGRPRPAAKLEKGYHLYYQGQWHLVGSVLQNGSSQVIVEFVDDPLLFLIDPNVPDAPRYLSRSPQEQIMAVGVEERRRAALRAG